MRSIGVVLLLMTQGGLVSADELLPPDKVHGWRNELQPYLFVPVNTSGDVGVAGMELPVDVGIGDVLDNLQFAGEARLEMWKRWLGLIVDSTFTQLSKDTSTMRGTLIGVSSRNYTVDAMLGFRLATLRGEATNPAISFEVDGGARVGWADVAASIGPVMRDSNTVDFSGLVGARVPLRLSNHWLIGVKGVVALPGPDWTVSGGVEYDISREWRAILAYRAVGINQSGPDIDVIAHGPYVGFGFRFGAAPIY